MPMSEFAACIYEIFKIASDHMKFQSAQNSKQELIYDFSKNARNNISTDFHIASCAFERIFPRCSIRLLLTGLCRPHPGYRKYSQILLQAHEALGYNEKN